MIRNLTELNVLQPARLAGCAGCPCQSTCSSKLRGLAGLGCPCASGCTGCSRGLGFISTAGESGFDLSSLDWKVWALIALAAYVILHQLFFRFDTQSKRKTRRAAVRKAGEDYRRALAAARSGKKLKEEFA